ncbi:MAG: hypothetical protein PUB42_05875 [Firmicutes bacterium]|nr:hypothetical protein [Bacillota bacterium]
MRKIIPFEQINEVSEYMNEKVFSYIDALQSENFEEYEDFDLLAFDWYDVHSECTQTSKMVIYLDKEDLFFFCADDAALLCVRTICNEIENQEIISNEQLLYIFFVKLLKGDMSFLDKLEAEMNEAEEQILGGSKKTRQSRWQNGAVNFCG